MSSTMCLLSNVNFNYQTGVVFKRTGFTVVLALLFCEKNATYTIGVKNILQISMVIRCGFYVISRGLAGLLNVV